MKRNLEKYLLDWKKKKKRAPLLIRGARQVGKSYIVEEFGKKYFSNITVANFEFMPNLKECFTTLDPKDIINKLGLILGSTIDNNTLLFLDEIQDCPNAILSLRYFTEKMPGLAVICAGSLVEFAFKRENFRMPVGRVQFLNLEPLSFYEFLDASGNGRLRAYLGAVSFHAPVEAALHKKMLDLLRTYLVIGGMPAVVAEYRESLNFMECRHIQASLLETYRNDFGKYANLTHHKYLEKVFDAAPRLVGQKIKYVRIDAEARSRELKNAIELLTLAKIIRPVLAAGGSGPPLGAGENPQKFKLTFLDVGLMQHACGLQPDTQFSGDIMQINAGAVAEQFVAQELRAYADPYTENKLYFWSRDKRNSSAEVDYLLVQNGRIFPIEVKAGKTGALRSLRVYMENKKPLFGIRIWARELSFFDNILSVPLYMVGELPRLIGETRKK